MFQMQDVTYIIYVMTKMDSMDKDVIAIYRSQDGSLRTLINNLKGHHKLRQDNTNNFRHECV